MFTDGCLHVGVCNYTSLDHVSQFVADGDWSVDCHCLDCMYSERLRVLVMNAAYVCSWMSCWSISWSTVTLLDLESVLHIAESTTSLSTLHNHYKSESSLIKPTIYSTGNMIKKLKSNLPSYSKWQEREKHGQKALANCSCLGFCHVSNYVLPYVVCGPITHQLQAVSHFLSPVIVRVQVLVTSPIFYWWLCKCRRAELTEPLGESVLQS